MSIKISGAQLKLFLSDTDYWGSKIWDEISVSINGKDVLEDFDPWQIRDTDIIQFNYGYVCNEDDMSEQTNVVSFVKKWIKLQNTKHLVVSVSLDKADEIIQMLKDYGCKVIVN